MRNTKLTQPKKSVLAKRKGGNGGYSKRSIIKDTPANRRAFNLRNYHGNKMRTS